MIETVSDNDLINLIKIYKVLVKILVNEFPSDKELSLIKKYCCNLDEALSEHRKDNLDFFNWEMKDFKEFKNSEKNIKFDNLNICFDIVNEIKALCLKYRQSVNHFKINIGE